MSIIETVKPVNEIALIKGAKAFELSIPIEVIVEIEVNVGLTCAA